MDVKQEKHVYRFGLIGKNIEYSFSRAYFKKKFEAEGLQHSYENFDLETIDEFTELIKQNQNIKGMNVTICCSTTCRFIGASDLKYSNMAILNI